MYDCDSAQWKISDYDIERVGCCVRVTAASNVSGAKFIDDMTLEAPQEEFSTNFHVGGEPSALLNSWKTLPWRLRRVEIEDSRRSKGLKWGTEMKIKIGNWHQFAGFSSGGGPRCSCMQTSICAFVNSASGVTGDTNVTGSVSTSLIENQGKHDLLFAKERKRDLRGCCSDAEIFISRERVSTQSCRWGKDRLV